MCVRRAIGEGGLATRRNVGPKPERSLCVRLSSAASKFAVLGEWVGRLSARPFSRRSLRLASADATGSQSEGGDIVLATRDTTGIAVVAFQGRPLPKEHEAKPTPRARRPLTTSKLAAHLEQ